MIYSAIVSCFDEKGRPNPEAVAAAVEHNIVHSGVDGLFVNGSTGENPNMSNDQRKPMLKLMIEAAAGRVKCIAHIGTNVLEEFEELAEYSADLGYDAVAAVAPTYFPYDQEDYIRFFHTLADRSPLPLYVYNIPIRTHVHFTRDSFRRILAHPNIRGAKFTDADLDLFTSVRRDSPQADLLCGFDNLMVPFTALGADGAIGTSYNLTGKIARRVFDLTRTGRLEKARKEQFLLNDILEAMGGVRMIQLVKATLELYGVHCGDSRFPQPATSAEDREKAKVIYELVERYL